MKTFREVINEILERECKNKYGELSEKYGMICRVEIENYYQWINEGSKLKYRIYGDEKRLTKIADDFEGIVCIHRGKFDSIIIS